MTQDQIQLLDKYLSGDLTSDLVKETFGQEMKDIGFVKNELRQAIAQGNEMLIERAISLMWFSDDCNYFIDELNELLLNPNHKSHQVLTKKIQALGDPKSVPYIRKVLESNFDYLAYTCSDSDAIAKWFSWALFSIGTEDAITLMKEYTDSEDGGIRNEMIYRLNKVENK